MTQLLGAERPAPAQRAASRSGDNATRTRDGRTRERGGTTQGARESDSQPGHYVPRRVRAAYATRSREQTAQSRPDFAGAGAPPERERQGARAGTSVRGGGAAPPITQNLPEGRTFEESESRRPRSGFRLFVLIHATLTLAVGID